MQQGGPSQGAGTTGGGGGGVGPDGKAPKRVELGDKVDALKVQIKRTEDLIKSLNEVSSRVREGEIDDKLLAKLGVARNAARRAGTPFDKSKTQGKEIGVLTRDDKGKGKTQEPKKDGGEKIFESDEKPNIVDTPKIKIGDLPPDKIRELIDAGEVNVSPEYRRLIDYYFGELSEK